MMPKNLNWIAFAALLAAATLLAGMPLPAQAQPAAGDAAGAAIATITYANGRNRVKRASNGKLERAETDTKLFEGDVVTVVQGGRITVVYTASGIYQNINAGESGAISVNAQASGAANAQRVNPGTLDVVQDNSQGSLAAVGGTRERRNPRQPFPLSPRNTLLRPTDRIDLTWEAPDGGAPNYSVYVFCEGRRVYVAETPKTYVPLPKSVLELEPGRLYYWYVTRSDEEHMPTVKPMFKVLAKEQAAAMDARLQANLQLATAANDPAPLYLNARVLEQELVLDEAVDIYRKLYAANPGDSGLITALRGAYRKMGFYWEDVDRFVALLRRANPEFQPSRNVTATPIPGGVKVKWDPTTHDMVSKYEVSVVPASAPESAPISKQIVEQPAEMGKPLSADLKSLSPGKYRVRIRSLDSAGQPLRFDVEETASAEFEVK